MKRNRNKLIRLCGIGVLAMVALLFCACGGPSRLRPFKTKLSAEEHIANLRLLTEQKYAEQLEDGTITGFQVYTLWSFKEEPEYFLVEFDGSFDEIYIEGQGYLNIGYAFLIGYVVDEQYYMYDYYPQNIKSPYREQDLESEKMYYGYTVMAIKKGDKMVCIGNSPGGRETKLGAVLSQSKQRYLATHDYRQPNVCYKNENKKEN